MLERLLISGSGGQGVIMAGRALAGAALNHVPHITFFPDYGAEVRGGVSKCQVVLSSEEIASPVSDIFESMILMNQESLDCFLASTPTNGLVIINTSLCRMPTGDATNCIGVAATEIADRMGDTRIANFVMLGAYIRRRPFAPPARWSAP
jgi:2-oxoglutarate ferredoxin oxidoreductase subunit gamma